MAAFGGPAAYLGVPPVVGSASSTVRMPRRGGTNTKAPNVATPADSSMPFTRYTSYAQPPQKRNNRRVRPPSPRRPARRQSPWTSQKAVVAQPLHTKLPNLPVEADWPAVLGESDSDTMVPVVSETLEDVSGDEYEKERIRARKRRRRKPYREFRKRETNVMIVYNTKLKKIARRGNINGCLRLMDEMRAKGLAPDKYSYSIALSCCARADAADVATDLYDQMRQESVPVDDYILTNLLTVAANTSPPRIEMCCRLFRSAREPTLYMCNVLIDAFAREGRVTDCLTTYRYMGTRGLQPDSYTVSAMIKAYIQSGRLDEAVKQIHEMHACGLDVSPVVFGQVMDAYGRKGDMEKAVEVFDSMTLFGVQPTQITYNILIGACAHVAQMDRAFEIYEEMKATSSFRGDRYTLHCLMKCCITKRAGERALELYRRIRSSCFPCNQVSYRLALIAAGQIMDLDAVLEIAEDITAHRCIPREDTSAMLVASAIRCSDLESALRFFSAYVTRQTEEASVFAYLKVISEGLHLCEAHGGGDDGDSDYTIRVVDELERSWREGMHMVAEPL